jgi:hypothetical protein
VPPLSEADRERPPGARHPAHDILVPGLPGSETMTDIEVRCDVVTDGWRCRVRISEEDGASEHDVSIGKSGPFLRSILPDPGFADMDRLVRETFAFLLEREPRTSILRAFDLSDVSRYFPDYPSAIRRRIAP